MKNSNNLILTQADFEKLSNLVGNLDLEHFELLAEEIDRALIVEDEKIPHDVVSMNSKVSYQDLESGKENVVTVVYPDAANITENKVSVLAPIGSALIGLREGQTIQWPTPGGKQIRIKVLSVLKRDAA